MTGGFTGCSFQVIVSRVWRGPLCGLLDWTTDMEPAMAWAHSCVSMKVNTHTHLLLSWWCQLCTTPEGIETEMSNPPSFPPPSFPSLPPPSLPPLPCHIACQVPKV